MLTLTLLSKFSLMTCSLKNNSHFRSGIFRRSHSLSLLKLTAEVFIYLHSWVWWGTWDIRENISHSFPWGKQPMNILKGRELKLILRKRKQFQVYRVCGIGFPSTLIIHRPDINDSARNHIYKYFAIKFRVLRKPLMNFHQLGNNLMLLNYLLEGNPPFMWFCF